MDFRLLKTHFIKSIRKLKKCMWCGETIELGSNVVNESVVFEREFKSEYFHGECFTVMGQVVGLMDGDLEWSPGDYPRGGVESYEDKGWREYVEQEEREKAETVPEPITNVRDHLRVIWP